MRLTVDLDMSIFFLENSFLVALVFAEHYISKGFAVIYIGYVPFMGIFQFYLGDSLLILLVEHALFFIENCSDGYISVDITCINNIIQSSPQRVY